MVLLARNTDSFEAAVIDKDHYDCYYQQRPFRNSRFRLRCEVLTVFCLAGRRSTTASELVLLNFVYDSRFSLLIPEILTKKYFYNFLLNPKLFFDISFWKILQI